jgi:hypothetical protein
VVARELFEHLIERHRDAPWSRQLEERAPNHGSADALRRRWPARYNLMFVALLC